MKENKILLFDENSERSSEMDSGFKFKSIDSVIISSENELENIVNNSKNNIILITQQSLAKVSKLYNIKFKG